MTELVFPVAATLALVLVAIPVATLVCKVLLVVSRPPATAAGVRQAGSSARYLLLVAPVCVPVVWLISALGHHAEAEQAALTCLFDHLTESFCTEPLVIAFAVASAVVATFVWRRQVATRAVTRRRIAHDDVAARKVNLVCASYGRLRALRERIRLIEGEEIRTVGLFGRHIEISVELANRLGPDALAGALLHEAEHVRGFDPLRFVIISVVQTLNPFAALLTNELALWRAGREAICDEAAVHHGAEPCSLAEALVAAARPRCDHGSVAAHLGRGGGIELLRIRVTLLMGYVTSPPRCHCSRTAAKLAAVAIPLLVVLPHYWGDHVIVALHQGVERIAVDAFIER